MRESATQGPTMLIEAYWPIWEAFLYVLYVNILDKKIKAILMRLEAQKLLPIIYPA